MTAPAPHSQPEAAALRQAQPVCCYCDNDLSCAQCGREQPYDDVSALRSRVEELTKALQFIADGYDNCEVNHVDYRVKVYQVATEALAAPLEEDKTAPGYTQYTGFRP